MDSTFNRINTKIKIMSIEEIIKELNYILGVHPRYVNEEIETLINKLKDKS